jgi:hypothetical protein
MGHSKEVHSQYIKKFITWFKTILFFSISTHIFNVSTNKTH